MVRWTLYDTLAFLLLLSLLLPSLLIMFIPSTFKRPVSSWKALNLRKTLLMASSVRLKPLNCSRLPCVYAQETLTFLLTQKKTRSEERRVGKECRSRETAYEIGLGIPAEPLFRSSLLLPSLLIMFIPSTFKRPVSSWKALNLRKTLLMASSVRLKPLNCSRLPCVYAQETLTFLLTQKKTCVKNYVQKE